MDPRSGLEGLVRNAPRHLLFTGKGGVGKTSLSCAVALRLADAGRRVLLVSTDPASNLDEVLWTQLGEEPTAVAGAARLDAVNIDPVASAARYRERVVGPFREVLPEAAVRSIEEQLSGACTVEIAAFDEFAHLLGDGRLTESYDHIVFDTAPTGHTLRLLALPAAWSGFIEANETGTSCLGPLSGLAEKQSLYSTALATLSDSASTGLVLVSRPESGSLAEAARASRELADAGLRNQMLAVNGILTPKARDDVVAMAMERKGRSAIEEIPTELRMIASFEVAMAPFEIIGLDALRAIGRPTAASDRAPQAPVDAPKLPGLESLVERLAASRRGVVMTMGKGGVGKTTVARAIATSLARLGFPVRLTTTDPAGRFGVDEGADNMVVSRIDPRLETEEYRREILQSAESTLDAEGLRLLDEDLRSPCTEEIAVFRAFAREVDHGEHGFVVLDTAPTGHTLLLLDAAQAYHREVLRSKGRIPDEVRALLPRLRDPDFVRIVIVALPESTPIHEAMRLEEDLARADIKPFAWVINQSLSPLSLKDPVLASRRRAEAERLAEVVDSRSGGTVLVPWMDDPEDMLRPTSEKCCHRR